MQNQKADDNEIGLLEILLVLVKGWKLLIIIPFVVSIMTAFYTLTKPNIYTAKGLIVVGDDDNGGVGSLMSQLGGLASLAGGAAGSKSTGDLYITMLQTETIMDPIIDRFKLLDKFKTESRFSAYRKLDANTNVSLGKRDGVITIEVDDQDPKLAADLANAYIDELGNLTSLLKITGAGNNRAFLQKRLAEARHDLEKAEESLKAFQTKNKIVSVTDQAQATIGGIAQLAAQIALQEVQLATLQRQFTDNSQEVKTAKASIANLRAQISRLEGKGDASKSIPTVGDVPQLGQDYLRLMRNFKIQETVVEMLTKQYEVSKINEAKDVKPFQVLQKAKIPERKSSPKRAKMVIISALATGFLMMVVVFIREFSTRMSVEDRKRWEEICNTLKVRKQN